ncbi:hypothetical protein SAMN05444339_101431 [Loktanella atrilutea]|uniref:Uncharacterized protein n=1 Tax=Loktanella atrilutea TaxID=366533 RepID=A0A1M4TNQ1_LOKAT|nr:hypothetical protein [Loktanella atrilutea]SHE46139.1 hypothetical protein SAMN05444339_101431 [Loktanella atrilutea]
MQTMTKGFRGVSTLVTLNWDRMLTTAAMIAALYAGAYLALI